nr:MAG TPA: hypothetical protein [Crassvirales sp.]
MVMSHCGIPILLASLRRFAIGTPLSPVSA